jgi:hypothetical protein
MSERYRIFRLTIDLACSTEREAEDEAERMVDSGGYSETIFGGKVVSVDERPVKGSAFEGDEVFEEFQNQPSEEQP